MALLDWAIRKRVSESGVRLMQTAIFSVEPLGKEPERNLAARVHAASAARQVKDADGPVAATADVSARRARYELVTGMP